MRGCLILLGLLPLVWWQQAPAEATAEEEKYVTFGAIVRITKMELSLYEYDMDTDEMTEAVFRFDPKIKLKNIQSLEELAEGHPVDIIYVERKGVKVAVEISAALAEEE